MRKELTAPWHKESDRKPEVGGTVIAVKYWEEHDRYYGGEHFWDGKRWCDFVGRPNASAPDYWCYVADHKEAYKQIAVSGLIAVK